MSKIKLDSSHGNLPIRYLRFHIVAFFDGYNGSELNLGFSEPFIIGHNFESCLNWESALRLDSIFG